MKGKAFSKQIILSDLYMEVYVDPFNKRIRIDDYRGNVKKIVEKTEELSLIFKVEKCIIIGKAEHLIDFLESDFFCEAIVDAFFNGSKAYYVTKYYTLERKQSDQWLNEQQILMNVKALNPKNAKLDIPEEYQLEKMLKNDARDLALLYQKVFPIYPTPLHDFTYIEKIMEQGTIYYAFRKGGNIISAASAEVNMKYHNAELTDCATLPSYRKFGLMKYILEKLEEELINKGIYCAFSIARAQSFGMNAVLHQLHYKYRGKLINNCYIFDKLENMNMWVKDLAK